MTTIIPTIGRVVWFHPAANTAEGGFAHAEICAAIVAYVHSDTMVNLAVFDAQGNHHVRTSVPLLKEGEPHPASGYFCEWMPYQLGQAARAEAREREAEFDRAVPTAVPAYALPELGPDAVVSDGQTRNADGSIWARKPVNEGGAPYRTQYGFISPMKNPKLWELARKVYGGDFGPRFEQPWKANPWQIYSGNPAVLLDQGYAAPGEAKEGQSEINFMMFGYLLTPTGITWRPS